MIDIKYKMRKGCEELSPKKAHKEDAGYDLYSSVDIVVRSGSTICVPTGVYIEIPKGYYGAVCSKSGIALKKQTFVTNAPGIVDANFRGEVGVILTTMCDSSSMKIKKGDKIAQLLILPTPETNLVEVDELSDTSRGSGGFGSTGIR